MRRSVAAVALVGMLGLAPSALAGPGPSAFPTQARPRLTPIADPVSAPPGEPSVVWTEPQRSFSFNKPLSWTDVDTASEVGAPVLQIVASGPSGECWFTRVPHAPTAALPPDQLIKARAAPMTAELWNRVAEQQHLLAGEATLEETNVEMIGVWPVQTAWFSATDREVFGALHSRPGLDIWAFCTGKDARKHAALLRGVALSVLTPKDPQWIRMISAPQASLTAVP